MRLTVEISDSQLKDLLDVLRIKREDYESLTTWGTESKEPFCLRLEYARRILVARRVLELRNCESDAVDNTITNPE